MSWDAKLFQRHLTTRRFGRECVWLEEVDSTNRWLADEQNRFTMSGAAVVADHQTHGRGRRDRSWHDTPGASLLFSVLLRHPADKVTLGILSLTPAIALAECLSGRLGREHIVSLKWPNDVLVNRQKVAGVLGQSAIHGAGCTSVVGAGVNVTQRTNDFGEDYRARSTSLLIASGMAIPRELLLAEILNRWEQLFDDLLEKRFADLREKWCSFGPVKGSAVTRRESGESLSGHFEGLGDCGQLLLRDEQGALHELFTGDLSQ